jgi:hypothetical protein
MGNYLRGWILRLHEGHPLAADPYTFHGSLRGLMKRKIKGEIVAMHGVRLDIGRREMMVGKS